MRVTLAIVLSLLAGVALTGCSGVLVSSSGAGAESHFRHRELGYEIAYPAVLMDSGWQTQRLDQADLLVRHAEGASWALASNCRATTAPLRLLTAELTRATGGRLVEEGRPVEQAGLEGWSQRLERVEGDRRLQIKTVTLRGKRCTYDWILIASDEAEFGALEPRFDTWWRSFVPGPGERSEESDS